MREREPQQQRVYRGFRLRPYARAHAGHVQRIAVRPRTKALMTIYLCAQTHTFGRNGKAITGVFGIVDKIGRSRPGDAKRASAIHRYALGIAHTRQCALKGSRSFVKTNEQTILCHCPAKQGMRSRRLEAHPGPRARTSQQDRYAIVSEHVEIADGIVETRVSQRRGYRDMKIAGFIVRREIHHVAYCNHIRSLSTSPPRLRGQPLQHFSHFRNGMR